MAPMQHGRRLSAFLVAALLTCMVVLAFPAAAQSPTPSPTPTARQTPDETATATPTPSPASGPAADGAFALTVEPASEIVDGQFVRVDWSGFPPDGSVLIKQCAAPSDAAAQCSPEFSNGRTRPDGTGTELFQLLTTELPAGLVCDQDHPCSVGVFPDGADQGVLVKVTFAFPASACPTSAATAVTGSGASSAFLAIDSWLAAVCREPLSISVDYTLKNSVDGRRDLVQGLRDFAVSALPLAKAEQEQLTQAGQTVSYAPVSASALVFGYNLRDRTTLERVTDLVLTPELIAELFTGQVLNWNDQRIKELNPGYAFPTQVRAVGRADNSATTWLLTSWFDAVARAAYQKGGQAYRSGPTTTYPSAGDVDLRTGARAVALEVAKPSGDSDPTVFGYIGWMDSSTAALAGLPAVRIRLANGDTVAATTEAIGAAIAAMKAGTEGWPADPDFAAADADTWPLPVLTSVVVRSGLPKPAADTLAKFLRYTAAEGQGEALPAGYVPLPKAQGDATRAVAATLEAATATPSPRPSTPASPAAAGPRPAAPPPARRPGTPPVSSFRQPPATPTAPPLAVTVRAPQGGAAADSTPELAAAAEAEAEVPTPPLPSTPIILATESGSGLSVLPTVLALGGLLTIGGILTEFTAVLRRRPR